MTIIVGGGPTGLMTALALARGGIESTVLEARDAPTDALQSRAITWMPRGMDVAQAVGVLPALEAKALRRLRHTFLASGGRVLAVNDFQAVPSRHPFTLQIPQGDSERVLERAAAETGRVEVVRAARIPSVSSSDSGVSVEATVREHGRVFRGAWGVAADGAGSAVRRQLQIPISVVDYGAHSVVADFVGHADVPPTDSVLVLDSRRPHGLFPIAPRRWRLVYRVNPQEQLERAASPEKAAELLAQYFPATQLDDVTWTSAFRLRQANAAAYGRARWLLVGDAAHPRDPPPGPGGWWRCSAPGGSPGRSRSRTRSSLSAYEREQRAAAMRVQRSNARIFRHIRLRSRTAGAVRAYALALASRLAHVDRRMATEETLAHEPLSDLPVWLPEWAELTAAHPPASLPETGRSTNC